MLATGYSGLQLTAQIEQIDRYEACQWVYGTMAPVDMFTPFFPCANRTVGSFDLICVKTNNQATTGLVVQFAVSISVVVRMQCVKADSSVEQISSINIDVRG